MQPRNDGTLPEGNILRFILLILFFGLISLYSYPEIEMALNRSAQRSTLKDMFLWSRALSLYQTDHSSLPPMAGRLTFKKEILNPLAPYLTYFRLTDYWGNRLYIWTSRHADQYGIIPDEKTFIIASFGKDRIKENWQFNSQDFKSGFFIVTQVSDFNKDLIILNGSLVRGPK